MNGITKWSKWSWTALILIVFTIGLWFRSYALMESQRFIKRDSHLIAENFVKNRLGEQLAAQLTAQQPGLAPQDIRLQVAERINQAIASDPASFQKAVGDFLAQMPDSKTRKYEHHYLLGADSYHFFRLTRKLVETGRLSDKFKSGKYFDPLRTTPSGFWTPVPWHPYVGFFVYKVIGIFSDMPLMEAVSYVPLILLLPLCLAMTYLCRVLKFSWFAAFGAMMTMMMAPVFLQRSYFGWYDTDIYNLIFPVLIIALSLKAFEQERMKNLWVYIGITAAVTAVYSYFWVGWPFVFFICIGMAFIYFVLPLFIKGYRHFPGAGLYIGGYFLMTVAAVAVLSSPSQLIEYLVRGATFIGKFGSKSHDVWPNIFLTVGETHGISFIKLIYLCGNYVTFGFGFCGLACGLLYLRSDKKSLMHWFFFVLMSLPLLYLSLKTERFSLLFVIPLAVLAGYGINFLSFLLEWLVKLIRLSGLSNAGLKTAAGMLCVLFLLPMQLVFGHALGMKNDPIMNNAWYQSLQYLKNKTPENAIVYSWWPPGYFLTSIAERRVFADGGTQHLPETYWLARVFVSKSEAEALGIMRMLNHSGNKAVEYLQAENVPLYEVISILNIILPKSRADSAALLSTRLNPDLADGLLALTHPVSESQDPTYIYLYNEMVDKNLAISLLAKWNFRMAYEQRQLKKKVDKQDYIENVIALSGGVMTYQPASRLARKEGDELFFENGVKFNTQTHEATLVKAEQNVRGLPLTATYFDGENIHQKTQQPNRLDLSVLIVKENNDFTAVLADIDLVKSLLFRLYYMEGKDLDAFELINETVDRATNTEIQIFSVQV